MEKPTRKRTEAQKQRARERDKAKRDALLASGCCIYCARPRIPNEEGGTPKACATCAEMHRARTRAFNAAHPGVSNASRDRENLRAWRANQRANWEQNKRCVRCGKKRHANDARYCVSCRIKENTRTRKYRQKKREIVAIAQGRPSKNIKPLPIGAALPRLRGGSYKASFGLDTRTLWALEKLTERYEYEERAAGRVPQPYQNSRLIREVILRWQGKRIPPPINRFGIVRRHVCILLDEPCARILRYQADAFFKGNTARAFRALLQTAFSPNRAFTGSSVTSPRIKRF